MPETTPAPKIIYTETDESPALATYSFLPIVQAYSKTAGIDVEMTQVDRRHAVLLRETIENVLFGDKTGFGKASAFDRILIVALTVSLISEIK